MNNSKQSRNTWIVILIIPLSIKALDKALETEIRTRNNKEKEILQNLDDEVYKLTEKLDKESTERRLKLKELRDET